MTELIEVHTASGHPTGVIKLRDAIHADGDWHIASFIWVFDAKGRILLQRRASHKDVWPGLWDASAAGHVAAGETARSAARRELVEELGLEVRENDLEHAGDHREEHVHPNGIVDREHHALFFLRAEQPLDAYRPGPEVTAIGFVAADDVLRFAIARDALEIELVETVTTNRSIRRCVLRADDLVPYDSDYLVHVVEQVNAAGHA